MRVGFPGKVLQLKSEEDSLDVFIFHYIKRKVKAREAVRGQSRYVVLLQKVWKVCKYRWMINRA
jgi:hypothetical protein